MAIELENSKKHLVVKRSGKVEPYNPDKLYKVLLWAADGNEVIANSILEATKIRIYDRIPIALLYDEVMDTTYNLISRISPVYDKVLLNLYLQKMYKSSWNMTRNFYPSLPKVLKKFSDAGIIVDVTKHFTDDELTTLSKAINPSRDKLSSYLGMSTFFSKYSKNHNGSYELLQHGFMRLAIQSYLLDESPTRIDKIISRYDNLSLGLYTEATPKWKNSLTFNMQGASCCVHKPDDNTESINKVTSDIGQYSRHDGGNAADVSAFRASGSTIGSKGVSSGPIPFIRKFQAAVEGFNQSGTRPGICIVTYQWWHADIMSLLLLLDEGGQENQRARNLKYTLKVNRLFLRAIESGSDVHLFDPKDVPELLNTWGTEFEDLYQQAIDNGLTKTVISARAIAYELAKQRSETGNIYIFFSDNANEQSTFNDTIHSSNACVTGDTKILTKEFGNVPISEVAGQTLECWDGEQWVETPLFKTHNGYNKIYSISVTTGDTSVTIKASDYHKWYNSAGQMFRTKELTKGMILEGHIDADSGEPVNGGTISGIRLLEGSQPIYCGTSPRNNKLVFNGVLTGNCTEIMLPTKASKFNKAKLSMSMSDCKFTTTTIEETGLTALCNLSSINVAAWDKLDTPAKHSLAKELLEGSDNLIEWQYYPTADGELFNRGFRAIGIGMNNLAYLFASKGLPFDSEEARELMKELSSSMRDVFVEESRLLAKSRGSFQFFNKTSQSVPSRFATLFAIAPTSTSSLIINATEGIEPVSKLLAEKTGTYSTKQLAPELSSLGSKYSIAGDIPTKALYSLAAIRQECLGEMAQGQSVNTYMSNSDSAYDIISDIILAEELGLLSLYYLQSSTAIAEQCDSCGA